VSLYLEPLAQSTGWRLKFERRTGPQPARIELPAMLGSRSELTGITGAKFGREGSAILVESAAKAWEAIWKS
jgi:hypothetical protein